MHAWGHLPGLLLPVPCPAAEAIPMPHRWPPTLACSFGSVSCGLTAAFPWVLVYTVFFVLKNGVSLPRIPWGLLVSFLDPRLECLAWASEPWHQCDCFVDAILFPQSVGCPLGKYKSFCVNCPPAVLVASLLLDVASVLDGSRVLFWWLLNS